MKYIKKVSASYQGDTPIATSITSSSTNDEVAGAKAVYDGLQTKMNASSVITAFWRGTQTEYDALTTHDSTTLYIIDEE